MKEIIKPVIACMLVLIICLAAMIAYNYVIIGLVYPDGANVEDIDFLSLIGTFFSFVVCGILIGHIIYFYYYKHK